jgi:hypothetical protein
MSETFAKLLAKNGNLIGMLTAGGPVTLSMPNVHFHKTVINPCYKNGCVKKKDEKANL